MVLDIKIRKRHNKITPPKIEQLCNNLTIDYIKNPPPIA